MRDSKRDTDVKNRLLDSVAEGEGVLGDWQPGGKKRYLQNTY